jgi:hypothetical protein
MWLWARAHAEFLTSRLSFHHQRIPALETFRIILCRLDLAVLLEAFNAWLSVCDGERISLDEKALRGSKREVEPPWMVVCAFGQRVGVVGGEVLAQGQDRTEAALALLERVPLEGKLLTLDAGLMVRPVVRRVVEKGGRT